MYVDAFTLENTLTVVHMLRKPPQRSRWSCTYACYLTLGCPHLALSRRLFGDLKYLLMSCLYSSHVHNREQALTYAEYHTTEKVCSGSLSWEKTLHFKERHSFCCQLATDHREELPGLFIMSSWLYWPIKVTKGIMAETSDVRGVPVVGVQSSIKKQLHTAIRFIYRR